MNSWKTADGIARRRTVPFALLFIRPSEFSKGCWRTNALRAASQNPSRHAGERRNIFSNENYSDAKARAKSSIPRGCNFRFRRAGTTMCCGGLEYFRSMGDPPDPRVSEAIELLR